MNKFLENAHILTEEQIEAAFDDANEPPISDTDATIAFLQSIIDDQALQIEALNLRVKELLKNQCGCP